MADESRDCCSDDRFFSRIAEGDGRNAGSGAASFGAADVASDAGGCSFVRGAEPGSSFGEWVWRVGMRSRGGERGRQDAGGRGAECG